MFSPDTPVTITLPADLMREVLLALHARKMLVETNAVCESDTIAMIARRQLRRLDAALETVSESLGVSF